MTLPSNVAPNELVESAWGNDVVQSLVDHDAAIETLDWRVLWTPWAPAGSVSSVYVGSGGPGGQRHVFRTGHAAVTTNANGEAAVNFVSPFPYGVVSVVLQADGASNIFWWAMLTDTFITGFRFYAISGFGYPFATAHPPGVPDVWTIGSTAIQLNYVAWGV